MCAFEPPRLGAGRPRKSGFYRATGTCQHFNAVFDSLRRGKAIAETHGCGKKPASPNKNQGRPAREEVAFAISCGIVTVITCGVLLRSHTGHTQRRRWRNWAWLPGDHLNS